MLINKIAINLIYLFSVATAVIVNVQGFGPYPMQVSCTHCGAHVMTETMASPGLLTWLLSGTLFLVG